MATRYATGQYEQRPPRELARSKYVEDQNKKNFLNLLLWFVVIVIILLIIIGLLRPTALQNRDATGAPTGSVNWSSAILWSIIIAIIILGIYWLVKGHNK